MIPSTVDAAWLAEHLGEPDLFVADVRGPQAHAAGHIAGSRPLVLGPLPPVGEAELPELARLAALRLSSQGVTGAERLVLVDRGDGSQAMPAAQLAELAGHPQVAVLLGGIAGWPGQLETGALAPQEVEAMFVPRLDAVPTREEIVRRLADLHLVDARTDGEFAGYGGYPCDPRQGHIPGARLVQLHELYSGPGEPLPAEDVRAAVGLPEGAEIVTYCHSGSRSALATLALRSAGYRARNYPGSWHEWAQHGELPVES